MAAYDKKAAAHMTPFFVANTQLGLRAFSNAASNIESPVCRNPEDFSLWMLGEFDDDSGLIKAAEKPIHIAEAINLKKGAV